MVVGVTRPCCFGVTYRLHLQSKPSKKLGEPGWGLAELRCLLLAWLTFETLKMEAICSSETPGSLRAARRYSPEALTPQ
jgi:hypothetical protein